MENILDVVKKAGEEELTLSLSEFSCKANKDIQDILQLRAVDFAKKKILMTYLVFDEETGKLPGFFTLAHKVLKVPSGGISNTVKRRMDGYSRLDREDISYPVSAFLLAQLGKNYALEKEERIS